MIFAYVTAKFALPRYAHRFCPKKFTQPQLFACLVLKEFLKLDYRKLEAVLADSPEWCKAIELNSVPHFTTFQKAAQRLLVAQPSRRLLDWTVHVDACDERDDGMVTIGTRQVADEGLVQIVIDDNGAGIPPENLPQLFHPFFSSKGSRGTGLGLAVSQKILKEHGGRILVESRQGEGSRFTLEFPALSATEEAAQARADSAEPSSEFGTQLPADATPVSSATARRDEDPTATAPETECA